MPVTNYNWKLPLEKGINGYFKFNQSVEDAVKQDIQAALFTQKGTRVVYRDYGSNLEKYLFEPKTAELKGKIRIEISNVLTRWVKGISLNSIDVLFSEDIVPGSIYYTQVKVDDHTVIITINYEILSTSGLFKIPNQIITLLLKS